jgi:hypothetical protein
MFEDMFGRWEGRTLDPYNRKDAIEIAKNKMVDININGLAYKQQVITWIQNNPALTNADKARLTRAAVKIRHDESHDQQITRILRKQEQDPFNWWGF